MSQITLELKIQWLINLHNNDENKIYLDNNDYKVFKYSKIERKLNIEKDKK